jgi:hypothetical protein
LRRISSAASLCFFCSNFNLASCSSIR